MLKRILRGANIPVPQNWSIIDIWSLTHIAWGIVLGLVMDPWLAFTILALYEPLEVYWLSPLLYKKFKIVFGNEGLINSLSDLVFNTLGILIALYLL